MYRFVLLFIVCVFVACSQEQKAKPTKQEAALIRKQSKKSPIPYKLDRPNQIIIMDSELKEISSLAFDEENNTLLTNDDESGNFYTINTEEGYIMDKMNFGKRGDYEGITKVNNEVYIVKNNGNLHTYNLYSKNTEVFKNALSSKQDVEGLTYDNKNNTVLLACKGQSLSEKKTKKEKCIYAFDIISKKLNAEPYLCVLDDTLEEWVKQNYTAFSQKDLDKKIKRVKGFSPSGISFNTDQSRLYILSARESLLVVYKLTESRKELEWIHFFDEKKIPQPEGICFDDRNLLYISSEGKGFDGKIFKFAYREPKK